jgi:hypothetical protein
VAKLKVFRTTVGFHDAYVAAPSKKAALAAWGTEKDLFARGAAEQVTDPELMELALASPGEVVRVSRGTLRDQLAALGPSPRKSAPAKQALIKAEPDRPAPRLKKPKPPPSREPVDAAEAELDAARQRHDKELAEIREREAQLARDKASLQARHDREVARLEAALARKRGAYAAALRKWQQ